MDIFLETERLILRRLIADDLDNLVALDSDPTVMRFITGGKPTPREEIESRHLPRVLSYYDRYMGKGVWAVIERATGDFLGWISNRPVEGRSDEVELGYRLRQTAWGRGYATEAARVLIDKSFAELGIRRVVANTMTVNRGSRRVMEKIGMRFVRTFFEEWPEVIEGSEQGDVEFELLREDWEREQEAGTWWERGMHRGDVADQTTADTDDGTHGADEIEGVVDTLQRFLTAFAALDWEPFCDCFADDAMVFFPLIDHPERANGREQIEQLFHEVFARARASSASGPPYLALQPRDLSIRRMDESALVTFHLCDPGVLCRRTLILQHLAAGWKIVHLHASNLPIPDTQDEASA